MRCLLRRILFFVAPFALIAFQANTMEEFSGLKTYSPSSFWDIEDGSFRLQEDLPSMAYAANFIDRPSLERHLSIHFDDKQYITNDNLMTISKDILKENIKSIVAWIPFLGANFAVSCIIGQIPYHIYGVPQALETTQYLVDILIILNRFACKYYQTNGYGILRQEL